MASENADFSNHMFVVTSIILGLGLTEVLSGTGSWLRNRARIAMSLPLALWVILTFLTIVQAWFAVRSYVNVPPSFKLYILRIASDTSYFLLARMVLPDFSSPDVAKYFEKNAAGEFIHAEPVKEGTRERTVQPSPMLAELHREPALAGIFRGTWRRIWIFLAGIFGRVWRRTKIVFGAAEEAEDAPPSYQLRGYYWRNVVTLSCIGILTLATTMAAEYGYRSACNAVGWETTYFAKLGPRIVFGLALLALAVHGTIRKRRGSIPRGWLPEVGHTFVILVFACVFGYFIREFSLHPAPKAEECRIERASATSMASRRSSLFPTARSAPEWGGLQRLAPSGVTTAS